MKKILYIDMDGVVADFDAAIKAIDPTLETGDRFASYEERAARVDRICESNPTIFETLPLIHGAHNAVCALSQCFEIYFLSTPMWNVPESFTGKRIWLEQNFGDIAKKRLILTHRKDLAIGDFLVDDRLRNGVDKFAGEHVHFGTDTFPSWDIVLPYLLNKKGEHE